MPLSEFISLIIIGLLAGCLSGLLGIGGGMIIVPGLLISGLVSSQHQAQALSLGVLILPVTLPAFIRYYRQEKQSIALKFIVAIVLGSIVGNYVGATLANKLSNFWLSKIYGVILLWQAIKMLKNRGEARGKILAKKEFSARGYQFILAGLATGFVSGLVGVGGGIVLIPFLIYLGYSQHQAQGFSLGVLSLPLGALVSFLVYQNNYPTDFHYVLLIAGAFLVSSFIFSRLALKTSSRKLKLYFTIFIIINALYFIFFDRSKITTPQTKTSQTQILSIFYQSRLC